MMKNYQYNTKDEKYDQIEYVLQLGRTIQHPHPTLTFKYRIYFAYIIKAAENNL